jgi:hypothetical protein
MNKVDCQILRDLAKRVAEIASLPVMAERRAMWYKHNRLQRVRPLILVFPEGSWRELLPPSALQCTGEAARKMEEDLRRRIYSFEHFYDDKPVEKTWVVQKCIVNSGWGLEPRYHDSPEATGAWGFDPVIRTRDDLHKLRYPQISENRAQTQRDLDEAHDVFGGILDLKLKGVARVSFHLMSVYSRLRGLEQVMVDMYDNPAMLHDAMAFLTEGYRRLIRQYSDLGLLSLNNDETYHSSGGVSYSTELPKPDADPQHIRPTDMWASAETQELAQVSPKQHIEFAMRYEKRLLEPFGLNGYGCCDDLTDKLDYVMSIPNMRRISISPWANVERCAEKLQAKAIFSWKPHPAHVADFFDPPTIRQYIQHTLDVSKGCVIEMILKDTHTCGNHPERFTVWTETARDLAERY